MTKIEEFSRTFFQTQQNAPLRIAFYNKLNSGKDFVFK
ncbi:hypothetical protein LEP1GSC083_3048 [Leptospira interrogans serovar Pyrogenes str. L0374]|uniref:Uncharacterized protein n=4 Tax=Leptospira interrogans TaxID=173 RepID=M6K3Q3_LEPIR|nr:hypothetical protein G436_4750 [Leptospira interrogans serovar Hardjo str. Norma]EKO04473.1 hypothetical protein LEP1GSC077_0339 [Leptospira interrogans str. C10069]EKO24936.1 hypothetical protein LEP1GSC104_0602 [Leptospira interrogans str. UI 12621]EKO70380.1 hypothetical protein LEP1GSC069_1989 [Leptospira interrogans serovar Canicola str. Fiocruz LV133]EKO89627.1 hypothetical protein LEP1GSC009_0583 [Leptospira interrogans serovar Grippotyphosa str. Andaman]EKP21881.1 hypothetical prote